MTESRIEKLTRIGQEMAAAVDEMRAEAVDLTPDLTTKLAIRQIEGEAAWWRSVGHDRSASRTFDSMTGDSQQAVGTGVERVLAHLQSAGRLIPAGGMALTAEQVEDVRTVVFTKSGSDTYLLAGETVDRLRALFPATEPAEDGWGDVNPNDPQGRTYRETAEEYYSVPAEPAEEETKAEVFDLNALVRQLAQAGWRERERGEWFAHEPSIEWDTQLDWQQQIEYQVVRGILTELKRLGFLTLPASSPVVPAPTETGPWQTWEAVPEGATVKSANGERFRKTGVGAIHLLTNGVGDCCKISTATDLLPAPFVAVEEG